MLTDARAAGLDFISSADLQHRLRTADVGLLRRGRLLVIAGEEVTTRAGHWVATGLPAGTWVDWRYRPGDDKLADFTQLIAGPRGLAIAAHPRHRRAVDPLGLRPKLRRMDAVEVWNGPWDLRRRHGH